LTVDFVTAGALALAALDATSSSAPSSRSVVGHLDGHPVMLQLVPIGGCFELDQAPGFAFLQLQAAAASDGVTLQVNSAFRTFEQQAALRALYDAGKGNLAAQPGYSNHEDGRAVDLESAGGTNAAFHWLTANAAAWGFQRTVSSEPWHWEYVK
jgi:LAS superfamily LD-carboxypeptidase LdcB